jgi:hypothetical protein
VMIIRNDLQSGALGYRQQDSGIFQRLKTMAFVGHDQQVSAGALPRVVSCMKSYASVHNQRRRLTRILVL